MPNSYISPDGDLEDTFSDYYTIDKYCEGGTIWVWGQGNTYDYTTAAATTLSSPVQLTGGTTNWVYYGGNRGIHAAIKSDNTLWVWGSSSGGGLGNGATTAITSPTAFTMGGKWLQMSAGFDHAVYLNADGSLWCSGLNTYGAIGNSTITSVSTPVQTSAGGYNWKQVYANQYSSYGLKTDGTLWGWGRNNVGQLADSTVVNKSSPVQIAGNNWKSLPVGNQASNGPTMGAIKTDGTLWMWGYNSYGMLGDGSPTTTLYKSSPVQISGGGTNWKQLFLSDYTALCLKTDGTVWGWGYDSLGQLGLINTSGGQYSSPVLCLGGSSGWKQVAVAGGVTANFHSGGVKTDGTLWMWGSNYKGRCGDNTQTAAYSSPVQTIAGGNNWKSIHLHDYGISAGIYFYDNDNTYPGGILTNT